MSCVSSIDETQMHATVMYQSAFEYTIRCTLRERSAPSASVANSPSAGSFSTVAAERWRPTRSACPFSQPDHPRRRAARSFIRARSRSFFAASAPVSVAFSSCRP